MSCSFSGCAALEANNIYSTVEWWFHDLLSGLVLPCIEELEYAMKGLKCQSWCKIQKGNVLFGRSMGAVPFLLAHHASGNSIVCFKAKPP